MAVPIRITTEVLWVIELLIWESVSYVALVLIQYNFNEDEYTVYVTHAITYSVMLPLTAGSMAAFHSLLIFFSWVIMVKL